MIKTGFIHGLIIGVAISATSFILYWLLPENRWSTFTLAIVVIAAWYISARTYKKTCGPISFLAGRKEVTDLFRFAFGASLVWAPLVSFTTVDVTNFEPFLFLVTLVFVIPLATMQVVGAFFVSNMFIKEK